VAERMIRTCCARPHHGVVMRRLLALALAAVAVVAGLVVSSARRDAAAGTDVRPAVLDVLFVGNSLIGTRAATGEDTPDVVRRLARSAGRTVRTVKVIRFGSTLQQTWDAGAVRRALSGAARYDVVLLQEYSTLVVRDPARAARTLLRTYAPALSRALKPGGRVVLFKNWALARTAPFASRAAYVAALDAGYARLAAALPLPTVVAPVSDGFEAVVARAGVGALLVPDGKHPNDRAVYLDAALLYGLFFRTSPRDLPDLYVPAATAAGLRDAAATALGY
jgi:hypothetical protein